MKTNQLFGIGELCLLVFCATPLAYGQSITDGSSSSYGISVNLSIASLITTNSGQLGAVVGVSPQPYSQSVAVVPINISSGVPLVVNLATASGTIGGTASSDVDRRPGSRTTAATSKVENLSLDVATVLPLLPITPSIPLIRLNASTVNAGAEITGDSSSLAASTSVSLAGASLSILGTTIALPADLSAVPANTALAISVAGAAGVSVILNETTTTGNSVGGFTTTTNAIRIKLDAVNLGLVNVLNGDIIIGHAEARQEIDTDGDGILNGADADSDGDGIPDAVEIANARNGGDTDGDGIPDHFDLDSDNDGINDVIEAGGTDIDGDGRQDASGDGNPDEDGDGLVDSVDPDDQVAGGGKGVPLPVPDTDGDSTPNYLDLDSDNDGLSDLFESGQAPDGDISGVLPVTDDDGDGISNLADGLDGFGDAPGPLDPLPDSDGDGILDAYETDSNNDGIPDIVGTPNADLDGDGDGMIDDATDVDGDGIADVIDLNPGGFGGLPNPNGDSDGDGISNADEGNGRLDTDGDGIPDIFDQDSDGDGIPDLVEGNADFDRDGLPNARDLDSDGDGINDVIEAGGTDADGDGRQDASGDGNPDEDDDGLVDSVDPDDAVSGGGTGVPLNPPDSDGDLAPDYLDLDSDNDTISDLVESGSAAQDTNNDGIGDGPDEDQDGIAGTADGAPLVMGDAFDTAPRDTDGDGIPDYLDTNSDGAGAMDIVAAGNGALDADGDGRVDIITDVDGDGIADVVDADTTRPGGLKFTLVTFEQWVADQFDAQDAMNPAVSGPDADPDHDGFSNAMEYAFGSDPHDPGSTPSIVMTQDESGGVTTIGLDAQKDPRSYAFVIAQACRDLVSWQSAPGVVTVVQDEPARLKAQINSALDAGGDRSKGFIRIKVLIP